MPDENIYPISDRLLRRPEKERQLGRKGAVFWLCGLSGSGKSTLAIELEKRLSDREVHSVVLDGDNLRSTLNKDLGFSDEDRKENLRRVSEVAKLLVDNGMVVIVSFITPLDEFRKQAKNVIGHSDYFEIYVKTSFDVCRQRDVKGLYAKAEEGNVTSFTGKDSSFEQPTDPWLTIDTENASLDESADTLFQSVLKVIKF
ncbi:MAG: adenylyl-sulfate kinase [Opitutae bacterium]|nr:adenylyl-sulfate kinase [Opitutae bacterium]